MTTDYIPLYRKYRPQGLQELVGQEAIVQTLSNAILHNRLAHAYLFCGPRGTGKTSSARILAKSLNCSTGPTPSPCQTCPSCISITNGSALDVTEIDAASNNGVDQIRELTERVQFRAIEGQFRIYIIDEVHMLSTQAFNALLKTLEEPPPNVIFIFATTEAHKVLPTIVSRCQRFDFSRITRAQIEGRLKQVAELEAISVSPEAVTYIARHAKGGMRDALSLLDQVSVLGRQSADSPITVADIRLVTGAMSEEHLLRLTDHLTAQDPVAVLSELNQMIEHGVDAPQIIKELIHHFRNLLLVKACPVQDNALRDALDVSDDLLSALSKQAEQFAPEELPQMITRMAQLESQIRNASAPMLWLEIALLELCYRETIQTLHGLEARISQLESQLTGSGVSASASAKPPAQAAPKPAKAPVVQASITKPAEPAPQAIVPVEANPVMEQPVVAEDKSIPAAQPILETAPTVSQQNETEAASTPKNPDTDLPIVTESPQVADTAPEKSLGGSKADLHQQICAAIDSVMTRNLLEQQCELLEATDTNLVFGFVSDAILKVFNRPDKVTQLEKAVQTVTGKTHRLELTVRPAGSAPLKGQAPTAPAPAPVAQAPQVAPQPFHQEAPDEDPAAEFQAAALTSTQESLQTDIPIVPTMATIPAATRPAASNGAVSKTFDPTTATQEEFDLMESKRYTQELLQGRLLEI